MEIYSTFCDHSSCSKDFWFQDLWCQAYPLKIFKNNVEDFWWNMTLKIFRLPIIFDNFSPKNLWSSFQRIMVAKTVWIIITKCFVMELPCVKKVCDGFVMCWFSCYSICWRGISMFYSSSPLIQSVFQLSHFVMEYPQNKDVLSPKIFKDLWWKP